MTAPETIRLELTREELDDLIRALEERALRQSSYGLSPTKTLSLAVKLRNMLADSTGDGPKLV
jgi:hypothetical protein